MNETITWIPTTQPWPDTPRNVLICGVEGVVAGYCENSQWYDPSGWPIDAPRAWAECPRGPVCPHCDGTHTVEVPCPIEPGRFVRVPCEACR